MPRRLSLDRHPPMGVGIRDSPALRRKGKANGGATPLQRPFSGSSRRIRQSLFPVTHLLRLTLLLLVPLWLSLGAEALGIRLPFASVLSDWMHTRKEIDPTLVPPPGWREAAYLDANPDIAAAVRSGTLVSGYAHYLRHGRAEGRPGGPPDAGMPEAGMPEAGIAQAGGASAGTPAAGPARQIVEGRPEKAPEKGPEKAEPNRMAAVEAVPTATAAAAAAVPASAPAEPPAAESPAAPRPATSTPVPQAAAMAAAAPEPPAAKPPAPPPAGRPQPAPQLTPPQLTPLPASKPAPVVKPAPSQQPQGGGVLVSGLRTGNSGGTIRIVLDLDRPPRFEAPASQPDGSLTVTLPGTVWKTTPSGRLPAAGWSYRAEPAGEGSRLAILGGEGGPAAVKAIFAMPPDGDRSHRLVIDLTVPQAAPPAANPAPSNKPKPAARTATAEQKRT